jgi:hypothetical protein
MTDIGIEHIKNVIRSQSVELPNQSDMTIEELQQWINGYAVCFRSVMDILESMKDNKER